MLRQDDTIMCFLAQVTLGINFGAFYLTHLLADKLLQQPRSRIVFENSVSEVHGELNWDDLTYASTLIVNRKQTVSVPILLHMHQRLSDPSHHSPLAASCGLVSALVKMLVPVDMLLWSRL